jgi:hypothetical protein
VSQEENDLLSRPFTMDEVREAIFQLEHNKALGLDGFPTDFYHGSFLGISQWVFTLIQHELWDDNPTTEM